MRDAQVPSTKIIAGCVGCLFLTILSILTISFSPYARAYGGDNGIDIADTVIRPYIIPLYQDAVNSPHKLVSCQTLPLPVRCYTPQQIRTAYNIQPLIDAGLTGKGQTIVIIDFLKNPTINSDLQTFDRLFNQKAALLKVIAPFGIAPFNPASPQAISSELEIDLDVEWAHAIAPDATITLVLARTADFNDIYKATKYVVDHNLGDVISQSFGGPETCVERKTINQEHQIFSLARQKGITVFASAGDMGSFAPICNADLVPISAGPGVNYPASDPLVTSVGGTTLDLTAAGHYISETVWNNSEITVAGGATGGGFSHIFPRPAYQKGVPGIGSQRGLPDVAYDGDPMTGFPIITQAIIPGTVNLLPVGGTSAGSPQWAGLIALVNQALRRRIGFLNDRLYQIVRGNTGIYRHLFHDITTGNNAFTILAKGGNIVVPGYNAKPGWDPTTGIGTPKAQALLHFFLSTERRKPIQRRINPPLSTKRSMLIQPVPRDVERKSLLRCSSLHKSGCRHEHRRRAHHTRCHRN